MILTVSFCLTPTLRHQEKAGEAVDAVVASPSSDKENSSGLGVTKGEAAKTYSRKNPVLVQKVLSFNKEEVKPSPASKQQQEEEKMETESDSPPSVAPWGRCLASGPDCPVHSSIQPRTHWAYYSTAQQVVGLGVKQLRKAILLSKIWSYKF